MRARLGFLGGIRSEPPCSGAGSTRLVNITRRANVLIRETDTRRFRPLVQKVLSRATFSRSSQSGTMVGEAETTEIIGAVGSGWTTRLRMRLQGNTSQAEVGAQQSTMQVVRSVVNCFVAGTLIRMGNGQMRPIESIKAGDAVASRDEETHANSTQRVLHAFHRRAERLLRLRFGSQSIETTPEHPFFVQGQGFQPAKYLRAGMLVLALQQPVEVTAVQEVEQARTVYNFEVENTHTYFVGSGALWVHNQCNYNSRVKFKAWLDLDNARNPIPNSDFLGHVIRGEGLRNREIKGAHNMKELFKYLHTPKGQYIQIVRTTQHPSIRGIVLVEYRAAILDAQLNATGAFRPTILKKTVYDPAFISDADHVRWIYEARQYALAHGSTLTDGTYWIGRARNGAQIEGYATASGEVKTGYIRGWR